MAANHISFSPHIRRPTGFTVLMAYRCIATITSPMKALRILIADDHDLMRRGIKGLLQSHAGWEVCGEAHTGREAVSKAQELKPDIAILDISMPDLNGVDAARRI